MGESRRTDRLSRAGAVGTASDGRLLDWFASGEVGVAEAAFEELVDRHGPMVLRVCREVLRDPHDADDAFQVVFLVLATRAGAIRRRDSLASWLFGVARRASARVRRSAARRSARDRAAAVRPSERGAPDELDFAILHEEIEALPERLRAPVILCHLQGLTYDQAADRLGVTEPAIRGRLTRARDRLRRRLTRRGASIPAALALAGAASAGEAAVPAAPALSSSRIAPGIATGGDVSRLAREVARSVRFDRWRWTTATAALVAAAGLGAWRATAPAGAPAPAVVRQASPRPGAGRPTFRMVGAVRVEATGEPVAGATIRVMTGGAVRVPQGDFREATTGPDGRYSVELEPGYARAWNFIPPAGYWTPDDLKNVEDVIVTDDRPVHQKDYAVRRGVVWAFRLVREGDARPVVGRRMAARGSPGKSDAHGIARLTLPAEGVTDALIDVLGEREWEPPLRAIDPLRSEAGFRPDAARSIRKEEGPPVTFRIVDEAGKTASITESWERRSRLEPRIEDGRLVVRVIQPGPAPIPEADLVGKVVDASGASIAGARAGLVWMEGEGQGGAGTLTPLAGTTDERGEFRIRSIPRTRSDGTPALVALTVSKDGFTTVDTPNLRFEPPAGAPQVAPAVALRPGLAFRGRVVDREGRPVEGAWIRTGGSYAALSRVVRTDRDGRFSLHGHPAGRIAVDVVYGRRRGGGMCTALPGAPPTTIRLDPE